MSLDAFIRAAGGVMGSAREGFGVGDVIGLDFPLPPVPPTAPPAGVGAAADAHEAATEDLVTDAQRLAQQDTAGDAVLAAAVSQSQGGRMRMDKVIASAIADVEAMGLSTSTPQGKQALIEAIGRHLRETKATVGEGTADAGTHAAASEATAAGYRGIGMQGVPGGAMPMGGMPSMGGMPGIGSGGGMPSMGALSGLSSLIPTSALRGLGNAVGERSINADGVPSRKAGDLDRPGLASEKGLQKYTKLINRAITAAFPEITDIGGVRPDSLRWHPQGLALDVMIPNSDTAAGKALGDRVVKFLVANRETLGVDHMIWRQNMIQPDGSASPMAGRGSATANHFDHVHVTSIGGGY